MYETTINVVKSHEDAVLPSQKIGDIGFDLYAVEDVKIPPCKVAKINTGLRFAEGPDYAGMDNRSRWASLAKIEGRSGLASKGVFPVGGIIDPSYRGDIIVCLYNSNEHLYGHQIYAGERIAQIVFYPTLANKENHKVEFKFVEEQTSSDRGNKGFGSSGK